jgi:hypothetical protein
MGLSDCPKCWDTPCVCGHEYEGRSEKYKEELVRAIGSDYVNNLEERVADLSQRLNTIRNIVSSMKGRNAEGILPMDMSSIFQYLNQACLGQITYKNGVITQKYNDRSI